MSISSNKLSPNHLLSIKIMKKKNTGVEEIIQGHRAKNGSCKEMKRALPSVAVMGGMSRTDIIRIVKPNKGRYDNNSAKQAKRQEGCAVM